MSHLLDFEDTYKPPFRPKTRHYVPTEEESLSALNNLGHEKVAQDFEDSPFADRKPLAPET